MTAIQHVYSSLCEQLDRGRTVFPVLIDLSTALDTISHQHLINLLAGSSSRLVARPVNSVGAPSIGASHNPMLVYEK